MTAHFKIAAVLLLVFIGLNAFVPGLPGPQNPQEASILPKLSDYSFFTGRLADLNPAPNVFPYNVNAALFSDYAEKARFVYLPEGQSMGYQAEKAFDFPAGAVLIKHFYYWNDAGKLENGRKILETRLLMRDAKAWKALTYVWNAEQTDALLEVAGASIKQEWTDKSGKKQTLAYTVPNLNQCKGCHSYDGAFVPIGLTAGQLNRIENGENQLLAWQKSGRLVLPEQTSPETFAVLPDYMATDEILVRQFPDAAPANLRARAYLEGNCAHCHNPHGPASTSGMFLEYKQTDPERLGIGKPPVAAGRGSGNRRYGIVPGKPKESILLFRMESDNPGIRMPELGRQLQHKEGVELIRKWIEGMK